MKPGVISPKPQNAFYSGWMETDECFCSPAREPQGLRNFVTLVGPAAHAAGYNDSVS